MALLDRLRRDARRDGIVKLVVGAVVPRPDGRVLLLHRRSDDFLGGLWELPSGGVEGTEDLLVALHREVTEETGLRITGDATYLGHFDYRSKSGKPTRQLNFTAHAEGNTVTLTEHDDFLWAGPDEHGRTSAQTQAILAIWRNDHGG
ncbi:NUDIX domain-containing protein [Streptomyces sp. TRM43335]|uniref:NUDIX domain-containing protein n=2 Tax=Streptomyces taklimakanensis TaxID=2569853 RepID=A0A6G2BJI8_9ACTN|nr:NUDIX domain-containing protein [Streptomyces taklimakanensis]